MNNNIQSDKTNKNISNANDTDNTQILDVSRMLANVRFRLQIKIRANLMLALESKEKPLRNKASDKG